MNKIVPISVLALLGMLMMTGCIKKKDTPISYTMTANVGGTAYKAALCIAFAGSSTMEIEAETTTSGATITYPYINLWLTGTSFSLGTFSFDSTMARNYAEYIISTSSFKIAQSGSITITSVTPNVVGTFSFTCTDGTTITDGKFVAENL